MKNYTDPSKKRRLNRLYVWLLRKLLAKVDFISVSKTSDTKEYIITFWNPKSRTSLWLKKNEKNDSQRIRTITHY